MEFPWCAGACGQVQTSSTNTRACDAHGRMNAGYTIKAPVSNGIGVPQRYPRGVLSCRISTYRRAEGDWLPCHQEF